MLQNLIISILFSTSLYIYLHKKTRISLRFLYKDNLAVILLGFVSSHLIMRCLPSDISFTIYFLNPMIIVCLAFTATMIRFWRTPKRKLTAMVDEIVSPADGTVIYIKEIEAGEIPISIKKGVTASLYEFLNTNILEVPCWLIGINMTPFDVHKNCAPVNGTVILNKHFHGKFLSLKNPDALRQNERNTLIIKYNNINIGIIQTASRLIKRIDTYVKEGDIIKQGEWFGMIRLGSQVDLIMPRNCKVLVKEGDQVYAVKSIIAKLLI